MSENRDPGIGLENQPIAETSPEQIRVELQKILSSQAFRSAHAQQAFLRYVVDEAMAGRAHQIKECIIGMEAFDRGSSFDPRLDPIVRTQAAKLRARLARYYETEGVEDPLRIEFRKGSYAPLFRKVTATAASPEPESAVIASELPRVAAVSPAAIPQKARPRWRWKSVAVLVALALTGSVLRFANLGKGSSDEFLNKGLVDQGAKILSRKVSPSASAYRNYLKGVYFRNKFTPDGLNTATQYLEQAVGGDPSFAQAYAALGQCYAMAPQVGTALPPEVVSKIRAAATRALQLDPTLGEAHFDLAMLAEFDFNWAKADAEFRKGLDLSPGNAVGHLWYAKYLALVGRRDEVFLHRRIAAELDPVSPYAVQALGGYLSVTGRYDEAIRQFSSALALEPDF
ncbi:MAG: hypothetical protein JOZ22_00530, partial [Acidobacteriia bacterium]|nr:hypothetical protein [Terriglobia bacterium]